MATIKKPTRATPRLPQGRIVWKKGVPVFTGQLPEAMKTATPEQIKDASYSPDADPR